MVVYTNCFIFYPAWNLLLASLSASVGAVLNTGDCFKIHGGILTHDGYTWYQLTHVSGTQVGNVQVYTARYLYVHRCPEVNNCYIIKNNRRLSKILKKSK